MKWISSSDISLFGLAVYVHLTLSTYPAVPSTPDAQESYRLVLSNEGNPKFQPLEFLTRYCASNPGFEHVSDDQLECCWEGCNIISAICDIFDLILPWFSLQHIYVIVDEWSFRRPRSLWWSSSGSLRFMRWETWNWNMGARILQWCLNMFGSQVVSLYLRIHSTDANGPQRYIHCYVVWDSPLGVGFEFESS